MCGASRTRTTQVILLASVYGAGISSKPARAALQSQEYKGVLGVVVPVVQLFSITLFEFAVFHAAWTFSCAQSSVVALRTPRE